ncbi:hypothetical protein DVDV_0738 [Desulfovibrio sp. DV]|nr:hypothetical protein DVDV_0738 [Desulfovibrio sp. DV]
MVFPLAWSASRQAGLALASARATEARARPGSTRQHPQPLGRDAGARKTE